LSGWFQIKYRKNTALLFTAVLFKPRKQLLNTRIKSAPVTTAKISRTADLKARQVKIQIPKNKYFIGRKFTDKEFD